MGIATSAQALPHVPAVFVLHRRISGHQRAVPGVCAGHRLPTDCPKELSQRLERVIKLLQQQESERERNKIFWRHFRETKNSLSSRHYPAGWARKPVTWVDMLDAAAYCQWKGARLPNEWEWQRAAQVSAARTTCCFSPCRRLQGDNSRVYPWGSSFDPTRVPTPFTGNTLPGTRATPAAAFAHGWRRQDRRTWTRIRPARRRTVCRTWWATCGSGPTRLATSTRAQRRSRAVATTRRRAPSGERKRARQKWNAVVC